MMNTKTSDKLTIMTDPFLAARAALFCAVLLVFGCRPSVKNVDGGPVHAENGAQPLAYAHGFSIRKQDSMTVVEVRRPWQGASANFTYLLVPSLEAPSGAAAGDARRGRGADTLVVPVPLQRVVTLTTTNLRHFEELGVLDALVGLGGGRYVCNPKVRANLESGKIREVGGDMQADIEAMIGLKPDLVFTFVVGNSSDGSMAKLAEASIPTAIDGAYMEETPLGRAEWIKFTAAFFNKGKMADSLFAQIESSYVSLADLARKAKSRPTVFVNAPFGGVWWVPGGRSYVARFLTDAGADYLWAADTTRGSLNLDMEAVLAKAGAADYWFNPGDWRSLGEGRKRDPRNAYFKAFKEGHVYNNDRIRGAAGGNDAFETGPSRPDWMLADLIAIFHPELLPDHALHWYRKLEEK
jgi:iron complex transport system substrate-binding protein